MLQGAAGAVALAGLGWGGRAAAQSATLPFAGLNLSGLASNSYVENAEIGTHYRAITAQHVAAAGACPLFRLPTTAARFTRGQGLALNETYCSQVQDALDHIAARGKRAIVELHDYMRLPQRVAVKSGYRRDASGTLVDARGNRIDDPAAAAVWADTYPLRNFGYQGYFDRRDGLLKLYEYRVIGTPGCTLYNASGLPDLWARIVNRFRQHPAVFGWGVMNEPYQATSASPTAACCRWQRTGRTPPLRAARPSSIATATTSCSCAATAMPVPGSGRRIRWACSTSPIPTTASSTKRTTIWTATGLAAATGSDRAGATKRSSPIPASRW
ncbi:degenerated cellulase [Xanthomonas arboricola pv. pruni str. MAFF 311562]|uniref:Degenerated cellulase n=1 Tax=Xanthomonas arboricola pv. pruni str. MAFF 311562 TaxID=1414836 RepID=W4S458_9XANT|nr:degenerated cellulase [Xanthomonas arboricola pv. pruni str. MAFF 311562]